MDSLTGMDSAAGRSEVDLGSIEIDWGSIGGRSGTNRGSIGARSGAERGPIGGRTGIDWDAAAAYAIRREPPLCVFAET